MMRSSTKTPCPICNRTSSGCRSDDGLLYCRIGTTCNPFSVHPNLKIGDVIDGWACVKINESAECVTFKEHQERLQTNFRQWIYFTSTGKRATRNRADFDRGPKEVSWSKGTKVADLLPLYYADLPDADGQIFLVEGEPCADALRQLGLNASSVPNGANSWSEGVPDLPKFHANRLVLCPDRDRPGIELMHRLAIEFPHSEWLLAESANRDAWSTPADGYDVADWVLDGVSLDHLLSAVRPGRPELPALPWYERLGEYRTDNGGLKQFQMLDLSRLLSDRLGEGLCWNMLRQQIEMDGSCMDEIDARLAYGDFQVAGIRVNKDVAQDALLHAARKRSYHPIKQYLDGCCTPLPDDVWSNLAGELLGPNADTFDNSVLRKWLIMCVARIYEPGCPYGFVHILVGDQHVGKTRFYNTLASEPWYYEGFIKSNKDADDITGLHMRWICEWGELDGGIGKHESSSLKNFVTRKTDLVREAYGKGHKERPRSFVLCGTTNKRDGFFSDETGNRRFVLFDIRQPIDCVRLEALRDQIWASARRDYLGGKSWYLDRDETDENNRRNLGMYAEDAWEDRIRAHLDIRKVTDFFTAADLLSNCLGIEVGNQHSGHLTRVNRVLTSMGLKRVRRMISGAYIRGYTRPV